MRHGLAAPFPDVEAAAGAVAGLHSSDPATVYLSARARVDGFAAADLEDALYEWRSLLRILAMRRTMFVMPPDLAAVALAACARALAPPERRRLAGWVADQGLAEGDDPEEWLERLSADVLAALAARGEATAAQLTEDVPGLAKRISFGEGRTWAGTVGMSTRMLFLLAAEGLIVRARPRGTWLSSQYRWTRVDDWLDRPVVEWGAAEARAELVRRYLHAYGPATFTDVKWWSGWGVRDTRKALRDAGAVEVDLDEGVGFLPDQDLDPVASSGFVALLPGLDPAPMGWKERDWYLGPHAPALFDRNGNAGPTIWWDGRVVGGWAQRPDGEVAYRLLDDVGADAEEAVAQEAGELRRWLGATVVTPRFPTPLVKQLRT